MANQGQGSNAKGWKYVATIALSALVAAASAITDYIPEKAKPVVLALITIASNVYHLLSEL